MIKDNRVRRCIVRESEKVRSLLVERFKKLGLTNKAVVEHARANGIMFNEASLCRYTKTGNVRNSLTTESIMFLCDEYGIVLTLNVKRKGK